MAWDALAMQEERSSIDRFIDLRMEVYAPDPDDYRQPGELLLAVGGRWDRKTRQYVGEASTCVRVIVSPAQEECSRALAAWLPKHLEVRRRRNDGALADEALADVWGPDPITSFLLAGGRRSGKSHGLSWFGSAFALAVPGARIVLVSPKLDDTTELRDLIELSFTATAWRESKTDLIEFVNGSRIEFLTAAARNLKIGPCDMVGQNEAQMQSATSHEELAGNLIDSSGLLIATANPPKHELGTWVTAWFEEATSGQRPWGPAFRLDPRKNPHVPRSLFMQMRQRMTPRKYRREYLGDFTVPLSDVVFEQYDDGINRLMYRPPGWEDVTKEIAERYYDRAARWLVGADFDKKAGSSWVGARFYRMDPDDALEQAVMFIERCGTRYVDESAMARALHAERDPYGYPVFTSEGTIIVGDASGAYQNTQRDQDVSPSFGFLIAEGWEVIKPDPNMQRNPRRWDRFDVANQLLRDSDTQRPRVYVLHNAVDVVKSLRTFPARNGQPVKYHETAHVADCWTYLAWRRWGRDSSLSQLPPRTDGPGVELVPRPKPLL
jgi:hypothetical protein